MDAKQPLPCLVCGRELEPVFGNIERSLMQPADAVQFYAYGQYGSTVFDPMDDSQIHVNVCDGCLLDRRERVWHARHIRQPTLTVFSEPWNPERVPFDGGGG